MSDKNQLLMIFPKTLRSKLTEVLSEYEKLQEIRMRVNAPLICVIDGKEWMPDASGRRCNTPEKAYRVTMSDIKETMASVSHYSMYAYEEEIRQGFITIQGGHRVGIAGKVTLENSKIKTIQYISFLNIRIAHQIKGCALAVMKFLYSDGQFLHTLIISPPGCGKTTLLRDIVYQISQNKSGMSVALVDERSEIAACDMGIPQNDLGIRCDVLDGCPKSEGMMLMLRTMSPKIMAVDEIGSSADIEAVTNVIHGGCKIIATVHAASYEEVCTKPDFCKIVADRLFERYIILSRHEHVGKIEAVYDADGTLLYHG